MAIDVNVAAGLVLLPIIFYVIGIFKVRWLAVIGSILMIITGIVLAGDPDLIVSNYYTGTEWVTKTQTIPQSPLFQIIYMFIGAGLLLLIYFSLDRGQR